MLHAVDRHRLWTHLRRPHGAPARLVLSRRPVIPGCRPRYREVRLDLNRAQFALAGRGLRRSGDGTLRNAAGEPLTMYVLAHQGRVEEQETEVIASAWRSLGMPLDIAWLTPAQMPDGEYRRQVSGGDVRPPHAGLRQHGLDQRQFLGPENRWRSQNRNGYANLSSMICGVRCLDGALPGRASAPW